MSLSDTALVTLVQAKNYLRVDAAASLHVDAEFVGVGTGSAVEFDLDNTPVEGSLKLYVNDVLQVEDTDFTIAVATITFTTAPTLNHGITASYDYAASANTFESYDDDLLERLIEAATKKAEDYTGRAFVQREITETHIGDKRQVLKLYKLPAVEVTSITVGDDALSEYSERLTIGRIYHYTVWPLDYEIVIVYTAGYGVDRAATQVLVPDVVVAVLLMIAYLYENRVDLVHAESVSGIGSVTYELPLYVEKSGANILLSPYRVSVL